MVHTVIAIVMHGSIGNLPSFPYNCNKKNKKKMDSMFILYGHISVEDTEVMFC